MTVVDDGGGVGTAATRCPYAAEFWKFCVERQRGAPDTAPACVNADSPRHRGGDERVEVAVGGRLHLERLVSDVEQRFVVEDPGAEVGGRGGGSCGW